MLLLYLYMIFFPCSGFCGTESHAHTAAQDLKLSNKSAQPDSIFLGNKMWTIPLGKFSFADTVILYEPSPDTGHNNHSTPEMAINAPAAQEPEKNNFVSLRRGGYLIVKFTDNVLINGKGHDLLVIGKEGKLKEVLVWISADGVIYHFAGMVSTDNPALDIQSAAVNSPFFKYIRLRDNPDQYTQDETVTGAQIDAVAALNSAIRLSFPLDSIFSGLTAKLQPSALNKFSGAIDIINQIEFPVVVIEVHTDNAGTRDFLRSRSQAQADALADLFFDNIENPYIIYQPIGRGTSENIAPNNTEEEKLKNRRIIIYIHTKS